MGMVSTLVSTNATLVGGLRSKDQVLYLVGRHGFGGLVYCMFLCIRLFDAPAGRSMVCMESIATCMEFLMEDTTGDESRRHDNGYLCNKEYPEQQAAE